MVRILADLRISTTPCSHAFSTTGVIPAAASIDDEALAVATDDSGAATSSYECAAPAVKPVSVDRGPSAGWRYERFGAFGALPAVTGSGALMAGLLGGPNWERTYSDVLGPQSHDMLPEPSGTMALLSGLTLAVMVAGIFAAKLGWLRSKLGSAETPAEPRIPQAPRAPEGMTPPAAATETPESSGTVPSFGRIATGHGVGDSLLPPKMGGKAAGTEDGDKSKKGNKPGVRY